MVKKYINSCGGVIIREFSAIFKSIGIVNSISNKISPNNLCSFFTPAVPTTPAETTPAATTPAATTADITTPAATGKVILT